MKTYERVVNGYKVRQRLSDEDARRLGLLAAEPKAGPKVDEPAPVETAVATPANKKTGGRGRKLNRD